MFGGIAAAGSDRILYAGFDGTLLLLETDGTVSGQATVYPSGPDKVHLTCCLVDRDGTYLLGDALHHRVRRFTPGGLQVGLLGRTRTPGVEQEDLPGVLEGPCDLLRLDQGLLVACSGLQAEHGVQLLDSEHRRSFPRKGGWLRAQGLALIGEQIWVAETEAGAIRRHAADGAYVGDLELHPDLRRPLRLADDEHGNVLMVLAPETEAEEELFGVAHLDPDGNFEGWAVRAGEKEGGVTCPFDLAVLPDGRFVVADLPLGAPPEVRLQLFSADGRLLTCLVEDSGALIAKQRTWFEQLLRGDDAYQKARVHHFHSGGEPEHLRQAEALYAEAGDLLAMLGLGALRHHGLDDPNGAEQAYRAALDLGGHEGMIKERIAGCRHDLGDLDGAVEILQEAVEGATPPEAYHAAVERLGSYFLERAGETP